MAVFVETPGSKESPIFFVEMLPRNCAYKEVLIRRRVEVEPVCRVCGKEEELIVHLFCICSLAQQTWSISSLHPNFGNAQFTSCIEFWDAVEVQWQNKGNKDWCSALAAVMLWFIWKCRNGVVF